MSHRGNRLANARYAQRGAVLIVGLIILLLMTMIGVTAMQVTTQQERMAGNLRDRNIAFQAAEMALRTGEEDANTRRAFDGAGHYSLDGVAAPRAIFDLAQWTDTKSIALDHSVQGTVAVPRYMNEHLGPEGGFQLVPIETGNKPQHWLKGEGIRVSAYSVGGRADTAVILQSTYVRVPFDDN